MTLPLTKDWRSLEQVRWSKLEKDNEMFKKIQKHRYDLIIKSVHLDQKIQLKRYTRTEEQLVSRLQRLEKVKDAYNIATPAPPPPRVVPRVAKCRNPDHHHQQREETRETHSPSSSSSSGDEEEDEVGALPGRHPRRFRKGPPSLAVLTVMVQNFLSPLRPSSHSMAATAEPTPEVEVKRPPGRRRGSRRRSMMLRGNSFYLTT